MRLDAVQAQAQAQALLQALSARCRAAEIEAQMTVVDPSGAPIAPSANPAQDGEPMALSASTSTASSGFLPTP